MKRKNEKGGAAVAAIVIGLLMAIAGIILLAVLGKKAIGDIKPVSVTSSSSKTEESSAADSDTDDSSSDDGAIQSVYPSEAENFKMISVKNLTCKAAILLDMENDEILAGYRYDKKIYPASLTKLLTLLVASENIDDMNKTYTFKAADIDPLIEKNASRAGFEAGEKVTMKDLLYSSILVSGADGTLGLAKSISGSEKNFVQLMNDKIEELGLTGTEFVNASGLHNKNHYSTVEDIAIITKACFENPTCKKILTASTYKTSKTKQHPEGIELTSILASRFNGYYIDQNGDEKADAKVLGGKTGFTDEAGFTLSTICSKSGKNYICVTSKSTDEFKSVEDQIAIYEKYLPKNTAAKTDDSSSEVAENSSSKAS